METLFTLIYQFFYNSIFSGDIGVVTYYVNGEYDDTFNASLGDIAYKIADDGVGTIVTTTLDVYLSTICSIITILAIVLFCVFIIKKIIGIIFRLFTGSSSF